MEDLRVGYEYIFQNIKGVFKGQVVEKTKTTVVILNLDSSVQKRYTNESFNEQLVVIEKL